MTTTSARRDQLIASLRTKEDRDIFVEEEIDTGLPFQIRALRKERGWTQKELADRLGMSQEGVSRLENPNYGKFTLTTLKRLASVFDVALVVRFEPFSKLVDWVANLSSEDMAVPGFEHDPGLTQRLSVAEVIQDGAMAREIKSVQIPYQYSRPRPASTDVVAWRQDSTAPTWQVVNVG